MERKDAYNWDRRLELELNRLNGIYSKNHKPKNVIIVSDHNKKIVLDFVKECKAEGLSKPRIIHYLRLLRLSHGYLKKDFEKVTIKDMKRFIGKINGSDLAEWSKQGYRITMKKFYRWLCIEKLGQKLKRKEYPEVVDWINTTMKNGNSKLPEEMLNENDIKKLINNCDTIRDKCLIALMWDSGCRIGEILNLKIKHIVFDKNGGQIVVYGKTGSRRVRLIPSVPFLSNWIENHPTKENKDSFVFVGLGTRNKNKQLSYNGVDAFLRRLKKQSKIQKRINAHSFRHARATFFASRVREPILKEMFGWTQKSQMVAQYVHLSGQAVDKEVLKAQGVIKEDKAEDSKLKPIQCSICRKENDATATFCSQCGKPLSQEALFEYEQAMDFGLKVIAKRDKKLSEMEVPPKISMKNYIREITKEIIREEMKK